MNTENLFLTRQEMRMHLFLHLIKRHLPKQENYVFSKKTQLDLSIS